MATNTRSVTLRWQEKHRFEARTEGGAVTTVDGAGGGLSPSPMQLLLEALGGCMAIDVVDILQKGREELRELEVGVTGVRREEAPRKYVELSLEFVARGEDLSRTKVERAVNLSLDKYCSVFHTLDPALRERTNVELRVVEAGARTE